MSSHMGKGNYDSEARHSEFVNLRFAEYMQLLSLQNKPTRRVSRSLFAAKIARSPSRYVELLLLN